MSKSVSCGDPDLAALARSGQGLVCDIRCDHDGETNAVYGIIKAVECVSKAAVHAVRRA